MSIEKIGRRRFIKRISSTLLGMVVAKGFSPLPSFGKSDEAPSLTYRTLGRTGLKVVPVGMGVMNCSDPAVLLRAFDLGINFYDTADCYMWGRNEEMVGKAFQGKRDKVFIQTKVHQSDEKKMRASVERSLRRLKTDTIDVLVWHNLHSPEEVSDKRYVEFMTKMKKEGKARFTGFSAHNNMASLLIEASKGGHHDVALVSYNFTHSKKLKEAVALAEKSGIGIVAMKTQAGGYKREKMGGMSPHQAALKYVLMDQHVATAVPGVTTVEEIDECAAVMGTPLSGKNVDELKQYHAFLQGRICTMCGGCSGECPYGVPYHDLLRVVMYHDGYESKRQVQEAVSDTDILMKSEQCADCETCMIQCRRGLDIQGQVQLAQTIVSRSV
jgi:aryl-alcohol dehydrogenase-like predicted oxidoreductase